jgi:Protein of unknown function (DUF3300)
MNRAIVLYAATLAGLSLPAQAQYPPQQPSAPYYQPQTTSGQPTLSPQELSNLVAPIALYPDMLLSQVLAASTYPLELAQAQQWMQANAALRGRDLIEAAKQQNWDPSVQALVAFPDVINMLTRDIQWTTDLGNAFLSQQADMMDAIQRLRAAARDNGRLADTPQQRVTYEQQNGQNAIAIQPTDPQVVYPPVYNPEYVWGPPVYGVYPPLGYPAPGYGIVYGVATFLGALFTGLVSFGGWGWGLSWLTHGIFLNGLFFSHFGFHGYSGYGFRGGYGYAARAAWVHDPSHRLGVPYGNGYSSRGWAGRSGYAGSSYRDSNYRSSYQGGYQRGYQGNSRQMEAYRGLTQSAARGANNSYGNYGSSYRGGGYNYGNSRSYSGAAAARSYGGGYSSGGSRAYGGSFSSPHYSAPKSSGHFDGGHSGGGGGHFGGHGHSGGGGHSHGGGHKK